MRSNFSISARNSGQDLIVDIAGVFDGNSAWELINTITGKFKGKGRIVVDTTNVETVHPFGSAVLESLVKMNLFPKDKIVFRDTDTVCGGQSGLERFLGMDCAKRLKGKCTSTASIC